MYNIMKVQKRNGDMEDVSFDKILKRIQLLCNGEEFTKKLTIDPTIIAQKVCSEIYDGVTTTTLDELSYQIAISLYSTNLDYSILASRIVVSNHHKNTEGNFAKKVSMLYNAITNERSTPLVNSEFYELVNSNQEEIQSVIDYKRDYDFDFFGLKTLEKSYLYKVKNIYVYKSYIKIVKVFFLKIYKSLKAIKNVIAFFF